MKKFLCFVLFISAFLSIYSQTVDYLDIRDSLTSLTCGKVDIEEVYATRERLLNVDTTEIKSNMHRYYKDVANCYYRIWAKSKDIKDANFAIMYNRRAVRNNPEFAIGYWDIALVYSFLGKCDLADKYMNLYKERASQENWDLQQIDDLKKLCEEKEN